jgi:hypothetical protein
MKKLLACFAVFSAVGLMSSVASAATACSSLALPVNVSASVLMVGMPGCDAGGLNFSNFSVSSQPLGMTVSLSAVDTSVPGKVNLGFLVGGFNFTLPTNPTPDLQLVYEVKGPVNGVFNTFGGSNGTNIVETVCDSAGAFGGACKGTQLGQLVNGSPNGNPSISFGTQGDIWIIKDIGVSQGFTGNIGISGFANGTTSGVPEPMTLSMMGAGLLGLSLISRRRKKS